MFVKLAAPLALIGLLLLAGCGGEDGEGSGELAWKADPEVIVPPRLPGDRILRGEVSNESLERIKIDTKDLRLLDGDGRLVGASATFLSGYAHSIYPPTRGPIPDEERRRLGQFAEIEPGKSAPLTISWHEPDGPRRPVRLDYGAGSLSIPAATGSGDGAR